MMKIIIVLARQGLCLGGMAGWSSEMFEAKGGMVHFKECRSLTS